MLWFGLFACDVSVEQEVYIQQRPEDEDNESSDTSEALVDVDQDGFSVEEGDCDDWDPSVHPEAQEVWNYADDDCDGFEDVDGVHSGAVSFQAVAIFEGTSYSFEQQCDAQTNRDEGNLVLVVDCEVDQTQTMASVLLGGHLQVRTEENFVHDEWFEGPALFVSTGGDLEWDSQGISRLYWSSLETDGGDEISLQIELDALFLQIEMTGSIDRQ